MRMKRDPMMRRAIPVTFVMIEVTTTALMKMSKGSGSREKDQRSRLEACDDNPKDMAPHSA